MNDGSRQAGAQPGTPRRRRARELRILNQVAEALHSASDAQQALDQALALVAELLDLRTGWVWLLDPDTDQFYNAAALNLPPYLQEPVRMAGASCWCIEGFRAGRLAPGNIRLIQCSRLYPAVQGNDKEATLGLSCHASIPLSFQGRPLGIMNVTAPAWRELTPDELRLLETIAYQVGIAVERARLAEERARLARTEERTRLAREIHDTLAQGLAAVALQIEGAMTYVRSDPDLAMERLRRALTTVRDNLEEARRSVLDLRPAPLSGKPLPEALRALARSFTTETGIRTRLQTGMDVPPDLPAGVESELYRIAHEALTNVARHAGASRVTIGISRRNGTLRLVIRDDGGGFDLSGRGTTGLGITGMRERARLLGGRLRITSRAGRGTAVLAEVPVRGEGA
jgi:two-component system, NarL family, sensor kinase